nr:MAG TPA: hypothetical protein [Caudoviricetes sp.]
MEIYKIKDIITGETVYLNINMITYYTYTDNAVHIMFNGRESITVDFGDWRRLRMLSGIREITVPTSHLH